MNVRFLKSAEKKEMANILEKEFGLKELPYLFLETGKEKVRGFSGSLTKDELLELGSIANVEIIGLYMLKKEHDVRISFDALHLFQHHISKNILELTAEEYSLWIRGNDLKKKVSQGTYVVAYEGDFIGCGKSNGETLFNYIPKERRLRK